MKKKKQRTANRFNNRKTFFKDKSEKLYFIKDKKQLIGITENACFNLFTFLEIKWTDIEKEYKLLNKKKNENVPVVIQFDYKTFKKLIGDYTNELIIPIGFGLNDIKLIIVEKKVMQSIINLEKAEENKSKLLKI